MLESTSGRVGTLPPEAQTLEALYTRHAAQVFRHAFYLVGSKDDAEDLTQETFVRAHQALARFGARSSPQTWLLRICTNLCYDHLRQRQRQAPLPLADLPPPADPAEHATRHETTRRLLRVLDGLPPTDRTVLILHLLEGLSYTELAQVLGCTRPGAKMRTLRALRRLRERATSVLQEPPLP